MKASVSVIIPTFNRPKLLARAIQSAVSQTFKHLEILVISDSRDEKPVLQVIEQKDDTRIRYLTNERVKGGNGARNTGILNARGDYIAFLDDDDEWLPNKIENQLEYLSDKTKNFSGVFSAYLIQRKHKWIPQRYGMESLQVEGVLTSKVDIGSSSNLFFDGRVFNEIGIWDEHLKRQQDLEFLVRFLSKYRMAYDDNIGLKVYGHNPPDQKIIFNAREKYFVLVQKYVKNISIKDQRRFYSLHYRRQTGSLIKLGELKRGKDYYKMAIRYQLFHFRKDLLNLFLLVKATIIN